MVDKEGKKVELEVRVRSVPSNGRARVNKSLLEELDIENEATLEIIPVEGAFQNRKANVIVYADNMVEDGVIRLGGTDCESLGVSDGDDVYARVHIGAVDKVVKDTIQAEKDLVGKMTKGIMGEKEKDTKEE